MGLALIVHGGAGMIPLERYDAAREGCRAAAEAGWRILRDGGSALDAVQVAIAALEDNPGFNSGTGAVLTDDGRAQLDAGIMDGATLAAGAVAGVERVRNPIVLARAVLASPHVLLLGEGAERFATESNIALCDPAELVTASQHARWQRGYRDGDDVHVGAVADQATPTLETRLDGSKKRQNGHQTSAAVHADDTKHGTVGAVALDAHGNMAGGASTGGIAAKHPGRVGDTPLVGCGFYAENGVGGVSSTGRGEDFIRLVLARRAAEYMGRGLPAQAAATAAIRLLSERIGGSGGLIVLDGAGHVGYARNTPSMAHAYMIEGMKQPFAGV
jgi:L-asparaginase / beta-aspartyl-peptidase